MLLFSRIMRERIENILFNMNCIVLIVLMCAGLHRAVQ